MAQVVSVAELVLPSPEARRRKFPPGGPPGCRNRLLEWRHYLDVTQEELAAKANVSRNVIWRLERDPTYVPSTTSIQQLSLALGLRHTSVFSLNNEPWTED